MLSLRAGRGHDLIGALSGYAHADMVRARLVERDPRNVRALARSARTARLELDIVEGDAADPKRYDGAVPADLVLLCGVLGNISDDDVHATVRALPQLCQTGGTVVWTRSRRPPDLTPRGMSLPRRAAASRLRSPVQVHPMRNPRARCTR